MEFGLSGEEMGGWAGDWQLLQQIYVKDDWKWNKPIEADVERVSKAEMYVEV